MPGNIWIRLAIFAAIAFLGGAIILTEGATRLPPSMRTWQIASMAEEAKVTASDGAVLRGALFRPSPAKPIRGLVIALHGVGDHGFSLSGFALMLNRQGYVVLTPDSRAHGGSGGDQITYGLLERHDVHTWLDWLQARFPSQPLYGYGASLGGGILLQSLAVKPNRFRALIAECPFADFHTVAYDRVSGKFAIPRILLAPLVEPAFGYARLRYGLNLYDASPEDALKRTTSTPVLLIHGTADTNIPIEHSRRLHQASPASTELWEIPGATHVNAWATAGDAYERRVIEWFSQH